MSPLIRTILRRLRSAAVLLFVLWHLTFLVLTNATIHSEAIDATVGKYESYLGLDQRWGMFSSPLWRSAPFPAARIAFDDGSTEEVSSTNEPADMTRYARLSGWRQRKLEHYLITIDVERTYQEPMLRRLMESYVARWKREHPGDVRKPVRVTLLRRDFTMPVPGEPWEAKPTPVTTEKITFKLTE